MAYRGIEYFDRDGKPISEEEWIWKRFGSKDDKHWRVAYTRMSNDIEVSTVWLGANHNWSEGPPIIFETMVFASENYGGQWKERYATEAEAIEGHHKAVEMVLEMNREMDRAVEDVLAVAEQIIASGE